MSVEEYFAANRRLWNEWAAVHMRGEPLYYPIEEFKAGKAGLKPNTPDDLGPVAGKSILHLQCHFGMDTLMWAQQGARVTGVDFSTTAIEGARVLNEELGMDVAFVQSDIYELPAVLSGAFDIVITYYGTICWLLDLHRWAEIVAHYLKPDGFFYIADTHPFVEMIEGGDPSVSHPYLAYPYFSDGTPQRCDSCGDTYAASDVQTVNRINYQWKHRLADVINAVVEAGLHIEFLHEFPYSFCDIFNWPQGGIVDRMVQDGDGWWRLTGEEDSLPLMFSLKARREYDVAIAREKWQL